MATYVTARGKKAKNGKKNLKKRCADPSWSCSQEM
jgi:hypothetical protein